MDYIELNCKIENNSEDAREIITAELAELGYESFQECEEGVNAYISKDTFVEGAYNKIYCVEEKIFGNIIFTYNLYKDKNWNEYWEKNFQPVVVNEKLLVRASFHKINKKYEYEIVLEPKMSFGTGHHATTYLMLNAMINFDISGKDVLDIGCGTGILSVFASMKGAKHIIGFDNNDWAYTNAVENIALNRINNVEIILGEIRTLSMKKEFDIILANINRNVILDEMSHYINYLKTGGFIFFSGILKENFPEIDKEASGNNLVFIEKNEKDQWIMLKYRKDN